MALGKLGKYERVDVLGHGVSGIVYLAWDTLLKRQVALKEIDVQAADVSRFLDEARVMDRLRHPHIVHINGVDMIEGHVVIDMEYVKGRNLQQLLRAEGRLPWDRALEVAIETLDALDYAHSLHTVHRDIKPANILIDRTGGVKLVDFGLAEILATNSYAGGAGTYAYMAPEDFAEEHHSDHQSDIWAVGVTLYEMLTGERPFNVGNPKDPFAWRRVLREQPPAPLKPVRPAGAEGPDSGESIAPPPGLQAVVDRALAREKADRYQTAGEFRDDLRAIREGHAPMRAGEPLVRPGREPLRAPPVVAAPRVAVPAAPPAPPLAPAPVVPGNGVGAQPAPSRLGGILRRRQSVPMRVVAEPETVEFGEVRKGDERSARVHIRFVGNGGRVGGSVASAPGWLEVSPMTLDRRKQALSLKAVSSRVWDPGDYRDTLKLQTDAGEVQVPVSIRVLPARRTFGEVAAWFVPLVLATLLPAVTVAWGGQLSPTTARHLVPAAALGSGLLAAMLLLVCAEADLGIGERATCGVLMAIMAATVGVAVGIAAHAGSSDALSAMPATGVPFGILFAVQLGSRRHWTLWAAAIALLSLLASGVFASVLSGI